MTEQSTNGTAFAPGTSLTGDGPTTHGNGSPPAGTPIYPSMDLACLPGGKKSLCGISRRALSLGIAIGSMSLATLQLVFFEIYLWRATFFIATLALYHYLEFDVTARYNTPDAKVSSFLLSANGSAYNVAHTAALMELLIRSWLQSDYKPEWVRLPLDIPVIFPTIPVAVPVVVGVAFVVVGQYVRWAAMAEAGKSFNHVVQSTKKADHILVTTGIYSVSRHPSYFGFFWWGLGTQLVLGNHICFPAYAAILWKFFSNRIAKEEVFLVQFFGQDYVNYRKRTTVLIPFIR